MMLGQLREDRIRKTTCLPRIKKVKPIYVNILSKGAEEIHYKQKKKNKYGGERLHRLPQTVSCRWLPSILSS